VNLRISIHCTHCGLCAAICPDGAITRRRGRIVFEPSLCRTCAPGAAPLCMLHCPADAIRPAPRPKTAKRKDPVR